MFGGKTIAVVVPAHNEERLIGKAVSQVPTFVDSVIVVDDASTDGTRASLAAVTDRPGLCCIVHDVNQGVGRAIATGYRRALEIGADVVAVMAGDAQMDPADLPLLLEPLIRGAADYAKGDRLSWPGVFRVMPLDRFIGNHLLTLLTRVTSGYRALRDSQCGYTAISARALGSLDLDSLYPRYGYPNDLLAYLHALGARLAEVPVRPIYGPETSGISLYTGLVRVPWVALRSFFRRRKSTVLGRPLLQPAQD